MTNYMIIITFLKLKVYHPDLRSRSRPKFNGFFQMPLSVMLTYFMKIGPLVLSYPVDKQTNRHTKKQLTNRSENRYTPFCGNNNQVIVEDS